MQNGLNFFDCRTFFTPPQDLSRDQCSWGMYRSWHWPIEESMLWPTKEFISGPCLSSAYTDRLLTLFHLLARPSPRSLIVPCIPILLPRVLLTGCRGVSAWQVAPSSITCLCKLSLTSCACSDMLSVSFCCYLVHGTVIEVGSRVHLSVVSLFISSYLASSPVVSSDR